MTTPDRVGDMIARIQDLMQRFPDGKVPYEHSLPLTHEFILELCERVVTLEKATK
jgi:hypothetical protein